jgi:hypothetical protein
LQAHKAPRTVCSDSPRTMFAQRWKARMRAPRFH